MRGVLVNSSLCLSSVWLALLDHCLIGAAQMPISSEIIVLLVLQASAITAIAFMANGALPMVTGLITSDLSVRLKFFVLGLPLILLVISPVMISDSMYRARYGGINKFVVHAHVWNDLSCCGNPLHAWLAIKRNQDRRSKGTE